MRDIHHVEHRVEHRVDGAGVGAGTGSGGVSCLHGASVLARILVYGSVVIRARKANPRSICVRASESVGVEYCASRKQNATAMSGRVMRGILKAQEILFKYGTLIPRSDREAEASPEAIRWQSGRQLEWLRLLAAKTFETHWTWERIRKEYPAYKRSEIGHMLYIYDYKYSGEHRVLRLVFDGSRPG
jgi:hypothetical protein